MKTRRDLTEALRAYVEDKKFPGGFLKAVLCGDLYSTVVWATGEDKIRLCEIVAYVYAENNVPKLARGSVENFKAWVSDDE